MSKTVLAEFGQLLEVEQREAIGLILPFNEQGSTSAGPLLFPEGSVTLPEDAGRCKLLAGHSPAGVPVGKALELQVTPEGIMARFAFGSDDAASAAVTSASEGVVDAFSVEVTVSDMEPDGMTVRAAKLLAVALVPVPAFESARVASVLAEHHTDDTEQEEQEDMDKNTLTPGVMPGQGANAGEQGIKRKALGYTEVLAAIGGMVRGDVTPDAMAELTDITDAGTTGRSAPQWLGELWAGLVYERQIIPQLTQAPLTARKAVGYRWSTKPKVASWAGNKTDIPSFPAAVETVERTSELWAGGNDLDRSFFDFGETEFLNAYWEAMRESYAFETDQAAGKFVIAEAKKNTVSGTADGLIPAVARGAIAIQKALHMQATFVFISPDDYESILTMTELDAPKYLGMFPIADPSRWIMTDFVESGTVIMGTKSAATHYELAGSPLRSEAEHIAKGGMDRALFGYTAQMVNRPEGLVAVNFEAPTPAPVEP